MTSNFRHLTNCFALALGVLGPTVGASAQSTTTEYLVETATQRCQIAPTDSAEAFGQRLRTVLAKLPQQDQETLRAHRVTLCPSQVIGQLGLFNNTSKMWAIYYTNDKILALTDTGQTPDTFTATKLGEFLTKFAADLRHNNIFQVERMYYTRLVVVRNDSVYEWKSSFKDDRALLEKRPDLAVAPLRRDLFPPTR